MSQEFVVITAIVVVVLVAVLYVWPGLYMRLPPSPSDAQFWAKVCTMVYPLLPPLLLHIFFFPRGLPHLRTR